MTWADAWTGIIHGGSQMWKVNDMAAKSTALDHIREHAIDVPSLNILCPLAGDDQFVQYAWSQGHNVTAIDLVPAAVQEMRKQFSEDGWSKEEQENGMVVWKHESGTATLYEGNVMTALPELVQKFDAVYDKDSFGALDLNMRTDFCNRIASYVKPVTGIIYTEVKYKPGRTQGPPFHVEKEDLMLPGNFGTMFEHVASLGEVYKLSMPMQQTGHILRRLAKCLAK